MISSFMFQIPYQKPLLNGEVLSLVLSTEQFVCDE